MARIEKGKNFSRSRNRDRSIAKASPLQQQESQEDKTGSCSDEESVSRLGALNVLHKIKRGGPWGRVRRTCVIVDRASYGGHIREKCGSAIVIRRVSRKRCVPIGRRYISKRASLDKVRVYVPRPRAVRIIGVV